MGSERLDFNLLRLGHKWFEQGATEEVDRLLIREFGHEYSGDHLSEEYHEALCRLGARLKKLALDPLEVITEGCWLALRFGLRVSPVPTGNLGVVDGVYALGAGRTYHPLEAVLVDVAASRDWRQDVATALDVEAPWVSDFLDGFAREPESSTDGEYTQGYLTAERLRIARYHRDLPDRR